MRICSQELSPQPTEKLLEDFRPAVCCGRPIFYQDIKWMYRRYGANSSQNWEKIF
jgi:hypothetical protein